MLRKSRVERRDIKPRVYTTLHSSSSSSSSSSSTRAGTDCCPSLPHYQFRGPSIWRAGRHWSGDCPGFDSPDPARPGFGGPRPLNQLCCRCRCMGRPHGGRSHC